MIGTSFILILPCGGREEQGSRLPSPFAPPRPFHRFSLMIINRIRCGPGHFAALRLFCDQPVRYEMTRRLLPVLILFLSAILPWQAVHANSAAVQTTWRLLDYIAVDYAGAVADGKVI